MLIGLISLWTCFQGRPLRSSSNITVQFYHDDVIKWKHFPRYWPFVRGIHRFPVNSPQKGQWRGALMFSLICVWIKGWVNNGEAGDLRRYLAHHYNVTRWQRSHVIHSVECTLNTDTHSNGLVQDCSNSSALSTGLLHSCTKLSIPYVVSLDVNSLRPSDAYMRR